jgi:nitrile hydratase beta subunit
VSYTTHADLGGQLGAGAILPEPEEPPFHAAWEARALALTLAMGATGQWNIDISRAARETLPDYAALSYFQIWLAALEKLLLERGLAYRDELAAGQMLRAPQPVARVLHAADVAAMLRRGAATERPGATAPRFAVGQKVRTRSARVGHHTRLPGYAHGKVGVIERILGCHVFADAHAMSQGEAPQWLYTVVFDERELWGNVAPTQRVSVSVDAWESYLAHT